MDLLRARQYDDARVWYRGHLAEIVEDDTFTEHHRWELIDTPADFMLWFIEFCIQSKTGRIALSFVLEACVVHQRRYLGGFIADKLKTTPDIGGLSGADLIRSVVEQYHRHVGEALYCYLEALIDE